MIDLCTVADASISVLPAVASSPQEVIDCRCGGTREGALGHGQFSRRHRRSFIDLFNLVCFGPDKRNSGMLVHLGGR